MSFNPIDNLEGKVAVVTGGCGYLGYAICTRLAESGARVFSIVRRDIEDAQAMLNNLPNSHLQHVALLASITDTVALKEAVQQVRNLASRCDILVNNAGVAKGPAPISELSDEVFDNIMTINVRGTFASIREFAPLMQETGDGLIVNITSTAGMTGQHACVAYGASKAALDLLTRTMARTLGPSIRVLGIAPGVLEQITSGSVPRPQGFYENTAKGMPLKRIGTADDIAMTVLSCATSIRFATGTTFLVDGGRLA